MRRDARVVMRDEPKAGSGGSRAGRSTPWVALLVALALVGASPVPGPAAQPSPAGARVAPGAEPTASSSSSLTPSRLPTIISTPAPMAVAEYTVTRLDDGGGACTPQDCTLRAAVLAANADGMESVIFLQAGTYALSLPGAGEEAGLSGDLDVTARQRLTIRGEGSSGTVIDAGRIDRVFDVHPGADLELVGARVTGGEAQNGGGIRSRGTLSLVDVMVHDNSAALDGGGIYNEGGSLTLQRSEVTNNEAVNDGGGILSREASLEMRGGTVAGNSALDGGGIASYSGMLVLVDVQVTDNTAGDDGGGGYSRGPGAWAQIVGGSISQNRAADDGGGIYSRQGRLVLEGVQVTGNTAGGVDRNHDGRGILPLP